MSALEVTLKIFVIYKLCPLILSYGQVKVYFQVRRRANLVMYSRVDN